MKLNEQGVPADELRESMRQMASEDKQWKERLAAGVSYPAGDDVLEVAQQAYIDFFSVNALYPSIFPSTGRFEREVIEMTAGLLHGENAVGAISSGGTESNLLGVKSARDRARALRPEVTAPEIVAPASAHPSFQKAADYFGLELVSTPLTPDGLVDVPAYHAAVTDNTVLMVGSAPSTVLGMVDPIPKMAAPAEQRGISFHVDACVGGYFLPFTEKLGYDVIPWDFRVPGVTTISADLHKFGYTAKGASAILSRDPDIFQYQVFDFGPPERPQGYYVTPTIAGSRPGRGHRRRVGGAQIPGRGRVPQAGRRDDGLHEALPGPHQRHRGPHRARQAGHVPVRVHVQDDGHLRHRHRHGGQGLDGLQGQRPRQGDPLHAVAGTRALRRRLPARPGGRGGARSIGQDNRPRSRGELHLGARRAEDLSRGGLARFVDGLQGT